MDRRDEDVAALEEAVQALPHNLPLRRQLAEALRSAGRPAEALIHLDVVLERAPDDAQALVAAAACLCELGHHAQAQERYQAGVARDATVADAALEGRITRSLGEPRSRIRLVSSGPGAPPAAPPASPEAREGHEGPPRTPGRITFADVGGLDEVKQKIRLRLLYPLQRPELYAAFGQRPGGGLLLYGPPGCGKTFIARATAGEAGSAFIGVGIEEVLDMWLGQSEKRLHEVFQRARAQAPAVLFFDEVDALGGRRSALRHESYRTLVTQFLAELDGAVGGGREALLVLGATNAPWDVDAAFRRPGRFGDVLFVPPPDLRARVEILKLKLAGKPQADIDLAEVARRSELYSGADLVHVVDLACETALVRALEGGGIHPLTTDALLAALARVPPTTREWFVAARNFATYANEAGQYNEVLDYLRRHRLG
ncbi:MAG TPA: AAA family ATPase [Polyangia bacterium]|jgi:AAA+ superfamily predicted ATPase|nr:AAA family ATPase [Polyangia bacterium]